MHVVRLLAPRLDNEDHTKDVDFSPSGIRSAGRPATPTRMRAHRAGALGGRVRSARRRHPARAGAERRSCKSTADLNLYAALECDRARPSCERAEEAPCPNSTPSSSAPARPGRRWRTAWPVQARRVAIVERHRFGGTCVNTGCTPTKTLVASAYAAHLARRAGDFGVTIGGPVGVDMKKVKAAQGRTCRASPRGAWSAR